jgi:hypothetical protein
MASSSLNEAMLGKIDGEGKLSRLPTSGETMMACGLVDPRRNGDSVRAAWAVHAKAF